MTARGQKVLSVIALVGFLAMLGVAGAIETQPDPVSGCDTLHAQHMSNPNDIDIVQAAWDNGCPFYDKDGQHLYQWLPVNN